MLSLLFVLERNAIRFFYVSPALRFIPMKYRGCRFDQGYELRFVARKTDIVAEDS
jgi:hypothetical protein